MNYHRNLAHFPHVLQVQASPLKLMHRQVLHLRIILLNKKNIYLFIHNYHISFPKCHEPITDKTMKIRVNCNTKTGRKYLNQKGKREKESYKGLVRHSISLHALLTIQIEIWSQRHSNSDKPWKLKRQKQICILKRRTINKIKEA